MKIQKLWFDKEKLYILTSTGIELSQELKWYPRLMNATESQRNNYESDEMGIFWPELDEDVSLESFTYKDEDEPEMKRLFVKFPELNRTQVAARIGIPKSLLAAYICGAKTPSEARRQEIINALHSLGNELMFV